MNKIFKDILNGKVVVLGIGNTLKGDDAFGPALIERIKGSARAVCIDGGTAPENYLGKVVKEKPDTIIIVDAVHLDLKPGQYDILKKDDIVKCGFTTHDISPAMLIEYLEKETGADIYLLAVQPGNISFGAEMSNAVKNTIEEIRLMILN